ncbi:MAG: 5-oxoprolinase (ATP-hydrolyzing) [Myxococcota bacterium]|jgi:5-oxoprolinase (ATP-hydrolysing)
MRTWIDRGGTFTDVIHQDDDGCVTVRKVPSDRAVLGDLARGQLTFGTTVATNALLERTGDPVLLLVTAGFEDLPWIGDMTRPDLFDPDARWPRPMCTAVVGIHGRLDASGEEIEPLVLPADLPLEGIHSVAVVLLHSARNAAHEEAVARWVAVRWPDRFVSIGHRIDSDIGYLARIETALVDAAITPVLRRSLTRDRVPADALAMRSDGSLCSTERLRAPDAVLSGPAGGVVATAAVARQAGFDRAVGLDMGGTSTDVCRVDPSGLPRVSGHVRVAGVRIRRPMLEVVTIAAGGGSVLWTDGRTLGVGPESAGAHPGPQCYGRGGPPTLTDAALLAGLVDPDAFSPPLDRTAVELPGDAASFLTVARDQMAAALRRIATARGVDLRDHALVAFGGAAGQHAAAVAERLEIRTVLVHPCAAALSAWGQSIAPRSWESSRVISRPLVGGWGPVQSAWSTLADLAPRPGDAIRSVVLRHVGTNEAIRVTADTPDDARAAFDAAHRDRFGFDRDAPLELVSAALRVVEPAPAPLVVDTDPWDLGDRVVHGPFLITSQTTSIHVPAGWRAARIDGLLRLDAVAPAGSALPTDRTPLGVALWGSRFMTVAERAGDTLQRLARSVNIRERLDFSCAVFDGAGRLVANAPHIPVHLGAMGETVRDLIRVHPDAPSGSAWLTNHPDSGGSHLPDLTVVTPVICGDERWFVASRGHHVDVGGLTPGSMPPHSRTLDEEGVVCRQVPLLLDGTWLPPTALLTGSREPGTVEADLQAQVAANQLAARALAELGPPERISRWMAHLQDVADEAVADLLPRLPAHATARDSIAGVPLCLTLYRAEGRLEVNLTGTGGPHSGNLNAPRAVVRAAVLYALRVLVHRPIPLNDGAMRRVRLVLPSPSIVDPPAGAAIAGGNVETSQRIVDLMLRAAGHMAASAGTMSNITIGGHGWSLYETVGGGEGASARGAGASGRQVHMTNTRATDPEELETRLPVRVRRFALRPGSGGSGVHAGGDGLVRELEVTAPATAALLATRRTGAPGLGAGAGAPRDDRVIQGGIETPWDGQAVDLKPGDRVRVATPGGGGWSPTD